MLAVVARALAQVAPECAELAAEGVPPGYSEQAQRDFLLDYFAMATTLSPLHGPRPPPSIGIELAGIPPLGCRRRLVLLYEKSEDTNKTPVLPRLRLVGRLPDVGPVSPWFGLAYVPPVPVLGTRSVLVAAEGGAGVGVGPRWEVGARVHATLLKSVGEYSTPLDPDGAAHDDLLMASTFGADVVTGLDVGALTPYVSFGVTDASTFFYVGDDGTVVDNTSPFVGPVASAGVEGRVGEHLDAAAEVYGAWGVVVTVRVRVGWGW